MEHSTVRERLYEVALERNLRRSTINAYMRCLIQLGVLDQPLVEVTQEQVLERLWDLTNANTRRNCAIVARSVLGFKMRIPRSVPRRYDLPSEDTLRLALLTSPHEVRGLLAMYAGLRLGEACATTRDDLAGDRLRVTRQLLAMREPGKKTVVRMTETKTAANDVVIPWWLAERITGVTDQPHPDTVRESVKRSFVRVGVGHMTFHGLRHWYGTELLSRGAPLSLVSRQLRHSEVVTTLRHYSEFRESAIHDLLG